MKRVAEFIKNETMGQEVENSYCKYNLQITWLIEHPVRWDGHYYEPMTCLKKY
jgi:hypothetical protein